MLLIEDVYFLISVIYVSLNEINERYLEVIIHMASFPLLNPMRKFIFIIPQHLSFQQLV